MRSGPIFAALALLAPCARAEGQECPGPPPAAPIEAAPSSGATNATLDTFVRVTYAPGYFEPGGPGEHPASLIRLGECLGGCGVPCSIDEAVPVPGLIQVHGDDLFYVPDAPLTAFGQYVALATGVDGELETQFCTGGRFDTAPPILGAIERHAPVRVGPSCELPDGGYRVGLYFERAMDDGPPGSIEYLLYLTRGTGVESPRLVARARNYSARDITMSLLLEPELGTTPVCVQLAAVDGAGRVSVDDEQHCFDPITRTWFYGGCSASRSGPAGRTAFAAGALLGMILVRRSRRA